MRISINGKTIDIMDSIGGNSMVISGDNIMINGKQVDGVQIAQDRKLVVEVIKGTLHTVKADGSVNCKDVTGSVSAGGSVNCDDVGGNVSAGGSVNCDDVKGNASAGGSISCDEIHGTAMAGGRIVS